MSNKTNFDSRIYKFNANEDNMQIYKALNYTFNIVEFFAALSMKMFYNNARLGEFS